MSKPHLKFGFIGGGGWLARTIIKALLQEGVIEESQLGVSYRSAAPRDFSAALLTTDSQALVDASETVILSVRPADFPNLSIDAQGKLVISVMAGISLEQLSHRTRASRIVRAMPNVAASVGYSYTPWAATAGTTAADRAIVTRMFGACGICDEVATEHELDYLTGLSGSGPAFPALLAEALRADAVSQGVPPDIALRAVTQLLVGTGRLMENDPKPVDEIVREFVEYRGVVAAAIEGMRTSGFDASIQAGLAAALEKVKSLG